MRPRVWAPTARQVRIHSDHTDDLRREQDGWWVGEIEIEHGRDYAFLLDEDDQPLPDPRSTWQPDGVFGPSRAYDHSRFDWTDNAWRGRALPGSVIYELHIGTFTPDGTFDGAIKRLDHLVELGVGFVEVMPVNAFDGDRGWGYDGVLWYAVQQSYGGPDGLKRFVDACHQRGLGVLLDVVYNHLGPSGACLDRFGPYFAGSTPWGAGLNLDGPGSDEVRRYVLDNAVGWLRDFHIDGLRLDAVHALRDTRALHLLEELSATTDALAAALGRPLSLIAESDLNDPRMITSRDAGGLGLHAQWCDDVHHCLHATLTGESHGYYQEFAEAGLPGLADTLRKAFFHAGTYSGFRGRTHGRPVDPLRAPGHRFVVSLQNHDQIGNRAAGDRLSAGLSPGLLACGAAILLCSPFTPMIFMGEEWGARTPWPFFAGFPDPGLAEAVRDGRRAEFTGHGWAEAEVPDPMDPMTFQRAVLDWSEPDRDPHSRLLALYRELISLRREYPWLTDPRLRETHTTADAEQRILTVTRGPLRLLCNLSPASRLVPIAAGERLLLAWTSATIEETMAHLPPESFAITIAN